MKKKLKTELYHKKSIEIALDQFFNVLIKKGKLKENTTFKQFEEISQKEKAFIDAMKVDPGRVYSEFNKKLEKIKKDSIIQKI